MGLQRITDYNKNFNKPFLSKHILSLALPGRRDMTILYIDYGTVLFKHEYDITQQL